MIEFATIVAFAALQSVFGIGILFFGTPTLILLGFPFAETLSIVLPASVAVSCLQVVSGRRPEPAWRRTFWVWCLTPLIALLAAGLWFQWSLELELLIAGMLLVYVVIRISPAMHRWLQAVIRRKPKLWLAIIGGIHGLTNLGGGLLAIFCANNFDDKNEIRGHIAFCYLCFAAIQLALLAALTPGVMHWAQFGYAAAAGVVFLIVEKNVFAAIPGPAFERAFTVIVGGYSCLILLKVLGAFGNAA